MIEIKLHFDEDFLKIKETLTRIGIANINKKMIYQSCHIFHDSGKYYIAHFKDMMRHSGLQSDITQEDIDRKHEITRLLVEWGLCYTDGDIPEKVNDINLYIIPFKSKSDWTLISKYTMGNDNNDKVENGDRHKSQ